MFKLQSPSKHSPFDAIHLSRCFFYCSKQFLSSSILMPFLASAIFCLFVSPLPHQQNVPFEVFFHLGKQKKSLMEKSGEWGGWGTGVMLFFGQKLLNTQHSVGRWAHESPIMKWANTLKESSKKFTVAEQDLSQQCQLVHCYRWVPRTLTDTPEENFILLGPPSYIT